MAQYLAKHTDECCTQAVKHEGTATGSFVDVGGVQTYIAYAPDKSLDRIILFYCDVFGPKFLNNQLLCDWFAGHGYTVLAPDCFNGEELDKIMHNEGFNIYEWIAPLRISAPKLISEVFLPAMKAQFPAKAYASVGYCFGAPMVMTDLTTGSSTAGAVAHPSSLTDEHFKHSTAPLFLSCAEVDPVFGAESRHTAEAILAEGKRMYHFQLFGGVKHGFAVKGDMSNENERWAKEQSAWGILSWFDRFLKK
ncbi:alpha/beta-hydrolase [Calocera cornea HHB12733]|uniref:Alpha/beta-hydrolase n=1 Tax=Calocera cornea HHB12733 TaxID=1353952 RepID=A0A165FEL5_9BASI|nr:alpha/beta-hydrolase [Calocera cornea HHB12733]